MKAQELPMGTIVIIALGLLFFVILLMVFMNIGGFGDYFQGFFPSTSMLSCEVLCDQANGFEYNVDMLAETIPQIPFCAQGCSIPCSVLDSEATSRDLTSLCEQYPPT